MKTKPAGWDWVHSGPLSVSNFPANVSPISLSPAVYRAARPSGRSSSLAADLSRPEPPWWRTGWRRRKESDPGRRHRTRRSRSPTTTKHGRRSAENGPVRRGRRSGGTRPTGHLSSRTADWFRAVSVPLANWTICLTGRHLLVPYLPLWDGGGGE